MINKRQCLLRNEPGHSKNPASPRAGLSLSRIWSMLVFVADLVVADQGVP